MGADVVWPQAHEFTTEGKRRTGVGAVKAGDEIETGGFAGAVRANERNGLAFVNSKAEVLHRAKPAKPPAKVANDQGFSHRAAPSAHLPRSRVRPGHRRPSGRQSARMAAIESP